ncbi:MAG: extracellular solute-binding protein [Desulfitobacteriaceae bacterium]|nr:extracellular solute-binding protein [Desulfitobacteriaceae bacterium]
MKIRIAVATFAIVLASVSILSGCGTGNTTSTPSGASKISSSPDAEKSKLEFFEVDSVKYPKIDVKNKTVRFLSHWAPEGAELKDNRVRLKKAYGVELDCIRTTYDQLPTRLASLQASGDAPDVFLYHNQSYPSMFSKKMFQEIDSHIDFNDAYYAPMKSTSDVLSWQGKHYMLTSTSVDRFIWYNKTILERNGLDDPVDLYEQGEWTYEKLFEYAAELTQDTDADGNIDQWGIGGNSIYASMMASKNTQYVTVENGKFVNNIKSETMDEIMSYAFQITNEDRSFAWDYDNLFRSGNLALMYQGHWITTGDQVLTQMLKDGEIGYVPQPKFEGGEQRFLGEYGGYLIPKGAKNIDGALAFINYFYAYGSSDIYKSDWEGIVRGRGWTDLMINYYKSVNFEEVLIGPPPTFCGDTLRFHSEPLRRMVDENAPWAQIREEFYPLFQAEIEKENVNMG